MRTHARTVHARTRWSMTWRKWRQRSMTSPWQRDDATWFNRQQTVKHSTALTGRGRPRTCLCLCVTVCVSVSVCVVVRLVNGRTNRCTSVACYLTGANWRLSPDTHSAMTCRRHGSQVHSSAVSNPNLSPLWPFRISVINTSKSVRWKDLFENVDNHNKAIVDIKLRPWLNSPVTCSLMFDLIFSEPTER